MDIFNEVWENPELDELYHYGIKRRSGRYPWGSGDSPYQHSGDFLSRVYELRQVNGFKFVDEEGNVYTGDNAIAKSMDMSIKDFRLAYAIASNESRTRQVTTAKSLRDEGLSTSEIARKMGINESSVRSLFKQESEAKMMQAKNTADIIRKQIDENGMILIGKGAEKDLGVSRNKLDEALYLLEMEGYKSYGGGVPQINNAGKQTNIHVIGPKDMKDGDIFDYQNIHQLNESKMISYDNGETFVSAFQYPKSMDSSRLTVKYAENGGADKDGVIEIRRGCKDLDLGNSNYAQVRILVDDNYYIKGMAVYSDDLPKGKDILINSNKSEAGGVYGSLKKVDPKNAEAGNPFGALIKERGGQYTYLDPKTGKETLGLINKKSEEGDWNDWADKLPTQFLAKQNESLIKRQIKLTKDERTAEFEKICALTNPTVKKKLLEEFADSCDGASADLKLASLPGQKYRVILPVNSLKDNEVYAPTYQNGEKIALIRYPHAGTFEIPVLTVNNRNKEGERFLGKDAKDAIGITKKNAEKLSGADFDGDTVMCIPCAGNGKNLSVKITSRDQLPGLKGFDPTMSYGYSKKTVDKDGTEHYFRGDKEFKIMKKTQTEMGIVSNLITDMTVRGASDSEMAAAVRHSMVVIDAEKHKLDYRQSYEDNHIAALKKKYQKHTDAFTGEYKESGASTLFSQAKSNIDVPKRKGSPKIDEATGKNIYKLANETYIDKKGNKVLRTQKSKKMYEVDDAHILSSGSRKEVLYADYANHMKSLANEARKEIKRTGKISYDPQAAKKYDTEVKSLKANLNIALKNKPREQMAQIMANAAMKSRKQTYKEQGININSPEAKKELKKIGQMELNKARNKVGARKKSVPISSKEWEAIQKGAITETTLKEILNNTDLDVVRQYSMPRKSRTLTQAKISRIKSYANNGYTISEIASAMGISPSTVSEHLD